MPINQTTTTPQEINATELNEFLDPREILRVIGYEKSSPKLSETGSELRDFCPLHGGDHQRSLSINLTNHTYYCHKCMYGGDLIELYTMGMKLEGTEFVKIIEEMADRFNYPKFNTQNIATPQTRAKAAKEEFSFSNLENIWNRFLESGDHSYFEKKHIKKCDGIRFGNNQRGEPSIVVPYRDISGVLQAIQYIDEDIKRFQTGSSPSGSFFTIGSIETAKILYICEGLATSITIYESLGKSTPVVSVGSKNNLLKVFTALRDKYPHLKIVVALDVGAEDVIEKMDAPVEYCLPDFEWIEWKGDKAPTDFNDLISKCGQGMDVIKEQLENTIHKELENHHEKQIPSVTPRDLLKKEEEFLKKYRGKKYLGLKVKTIDEFNENFLGLRGLMLLAAAPNIGKTALTIQIGLEVLLQQEDTSLIYVSLEMTKEQIFRRMILNLSGISFKDFVLGSERQIPNTEEENEVFFTEKELGNIKEAETTLCNFKDRLHIIDTSLVPGINSETVIKYINILKEKSNTSKNIVIIDYLQVWPIDSKIRTTNEIEIDKLRIEEMKKIRNSVNPDEEPVIIISEARKPPNNGKIESWGGELSDVMGSARGTYTPDVVMLLLAIPPAKIVEFCKKDSCLEIEEKDGDAIKDLLAKNGVALCRLDVPKVRDGMQKFSIILEFHFHKNQFKKVNWDGINNILRENYSQNNMNDSENDSSENRNLNWDPTS